MKFTVDKCLIMHIEINRTTHTFLDAELAVTILGKKNPNKTNRKRM